MSTTQKSPAPAKNEQITLTFNPTDTPIRMETINGTLWFVAKDVCNALNIKWSGNSVTLAQIPDEWKGVLKFKTPGGMQELTTISESGMYKLAFRCQSSETADRFTNWVAGEVLPSIRRTGSYTVQPAARRGRKTRGELVNADILNLLWLIGESLNHGDQKEIALELGVSENSVSRTLNGYNRSNRILMALYKRARQNREAYMLYNQPALMADRLLNGTPIPEGNHLPAVKYDGRRGGQIGNQNARKNKGGTL